MLCLAQFPGEAHCPETDLLTQCPTQVPRDQHGTRVSPHVAKDKGQASLAGRARPSTQSSEEKDGQPLRPAWDFRGALYKELVHLKQNLKNDCLHSKEDGLEPSLLSLLRKLKWQRRSKSVLQSQQPADSATVFRRAPVATDSQLKQDENSE